MSKQAQRPKQVLRAALRDAGVSRRTFVKAVFPAHNQNGYRLLSGRGVSSTLARTICLIMYGMKNGESVNTRDWAKFFQEQGL